MTSLAEPFGAGLTVAISNSDGTIVVAARGEIDVSSVEPLWRSVEAAIATNGHVVIDLSAVTFMDSTGLNLLVQAHQAAGAQQGAVVVRAPRTQARKLLELTGVDRLITVEHA